MAAKQSVYDRLMVQQKQNGDLGDAFNMIIHNPYRILGASTFCGEAELQELYQRWENDPDGYRSKFDKTKLGIPNRTREDMRWALENADGYVYKLFWFSDPDIAVKLGNKSEFIDFFARKQDVNTTDYNSFLAQYIFLCIFDREFTMTEQWGVILNLINNLLNVSVGRFWAFFSGNKIEAIDNNKMAFLYNEFKDNILFPIRDIVNKPGNKVDLDELFHIQSVLNQVDKPQLPFSRIQNVLYERMEKWFIKESEYVNNVLLANVTSVNVTSMEEKLAIVEAYNYIINNIAPSFHRIVDNVIPSDHSMNTRLRMMFSGKFIVVSKILSNAGMYNESLNLCQVFNELFEDEYISNEIVNLNMILRQEETTRMAPHATGAAMGNASNDLGSGLSRPAELGELEKLQSERRKEFFKKKSQKGIDYKEVIQGVLNNELRLVNNDDLIEKDDREKEKEEIPYVDRMLEEAQAEAEAEALRLKTAMETMQKQHELELNTKIEALNAEYRQSMKKLLIAVIIIIVTAVALTGIMAVQLFKGGESGGQSDIPTLDRQEAIALQTQIKTLDSELDYLETSLSQLSSEIAEVSRLYDETGSSQYAEQFTEKQNQYNEIRSQYDEKVILYNELRDKYKSLTGQ